MEFLASIFENVFPSLKDFFAKTFGYVMSCGYYIEALENEMNELKSKRDDIKCMVDAAELHGKEPTSQVKLWLRTVAEFEEQASRVAGEFHARFEPLGLWATYSLSKRADEALEEARSLKERGAFDKVANERAQVRIQVVPSAPVVGMGQLLARLEAALGDDEASVVGIYGMAGVGKTALLSKFNNEVLATAADISIVIYVEVSKEYNLDAIQKLIGDRLGLSREKKSPMEHATLIYRVLSTMNFVLLLDDLWVPLDLRMLGIPVPTQASKSKILLTTRIEEVCDQMDVRRKIKAECLPWEEAWELFQEKVGDTLVRSNSKIWQHAEEMVTKCGGLPLALVTVGRAMASKRTAADWKHAITVLKFAPWQLLGTGTDLLNRLKHSYDNLPNDKLRACLLYCSLFPDDFSIYKEWIIGYYIAEGFVDDFYTDMDEIYSKGHDLLGALKTASLLERGDDEDHIKMHPMIRAMALWIASEFSTNENEWLMLAGIGLKEAPGAEKWGEAKRISLMRNNIHEMLERPDSPHLTTLLLQGNPLEFICDGFFRLMASLRVLDLSHTSISELPLGISSLTGLQYLDLCNSYIRSLPREVGALVNLRFLLLSNMPLLETIPDGVIGSLSALQVLYMDLSYGDWKVGSSGTGVDFQELESLRRLKALDITIETVGALERLSRSPRLAGCTRNLLVKGCTRLMTVKFPSSELWRNMSGLKRVWIANCVNLEEVIIDGIRGGDNIPGLHISRQSVIHKGHGSSTDNELPVLPSLQSIILQGLQNANIVWRGGCVQHLSFLYIWCCNGLEQLISCHEEEKSSEGASDGEASRVITVFPNLKELYLHALPNFKNFSTGRTLLAFPMLENLKVVECSQLKKLKLAAEGLKEIQCTQEWWDDLEWDGDYTESDFKPLFRQL